MNKLLSLIFILTYISAYPHNNFADMKEELNMWYQTKTTTSISYTKNPKTIDFPTQHYSICGIIDKGVLCDGTVARFYDTTSVVPELLLEGKVSYTVGRLVIDGVKYIRTSSGTNKIYGTFYVYNMDDFSMNYKPKKAGELRIKRDKISYLDGFFLDRAAIVRISNVNTIYLDKKNEGNSFTFLSAEIPNISIKDDDSFDTFEMLLQANDGVTMHWQDGTVFKGRVKPVPVEGRIRFIPLEGQRWGMPNGPKKISVQRDNGNIVFFQEYGEYNTLLYSEAWFVKDDGSLVEEDYWNKLKILENCYYAKWRYQNGDYFEGIIKYAITQNADSITSTISTTATKGIFKYQNGDRFEGDVSSSSVGPFFVDGTTYFIDGTITQGNWLNNFTLTNSQWQEVYRSPNPTSAKELAQKLMYQNAYPKYKYSNCIDYFDPDTEDQQSTCPDYIIYDKSKKYFICVFDDGNDLGSGFVVDDKGNIKLESSDHRRISLRFAIDDNGYRNWEIVYKDDKPTYINEFTWYSNGIIESIKSYSYSTKKLYLACYFFSDGKLRSAYQYGRGNTGENILRKSKEAHPSYGGYTCKLYDLNGNYERSIEWEIGIGYSLFGGSYVQEMAPEHIELSKMRQMNN